MLKAKIAAVEVQMKARLAEARATFEHPGDKGTAVEDSFRACSENDITWEYNGHSRPPTADQVEWQWHRAIPRI